jgi:hypothetical protein
VALGADVLSLIFINQIHKGKHMAYLVDRVDVWLGSLPDSPGELGKVLGTLSQAGARLEFLFARPKEAGQAVCFLAPVQGAAQCRVAKNAGFAKWASALRVQGSNKAGLAAKISQTLGEAGINMQGVSAMGMGNRCLFYIYLKKEDVIKAQRVLKQAL